MSEKRTIWKFPIPVDNEIKDVQMPVGAKILCLQMQRATPCLWAQVNPFNGREVRTFEWKGTGINESPQDNRNYIGTVQTHDGDYVFHLFEILP